MTSRQALQILNRQIANHLQCTRGYAIPLIRVGNRIQNLKTKSPISARNGACIRRHNLQSRSLQARKASNLNLKSSFPLAEPITRNFPHPHLRTYTTRAPLRTYKAPTQLRSSTGGWAIAVVLVISLLYTVPGYTTRRSQQKSENQTPSGLLEEAGEKFSDMAAETLPGRPENLTPEEEEKLRQFWVATLQILGVIEAKGLAENGNGDANRTRSDTATSKKSTPKKRMSMFRRNKEEKTETPLSPTLDGNNDDDKYGQTKEFHDALANMPPETLREHFWSMMKHDNPDAFLLRFLRARKWDVEKALVMMFSTIRWRALDVHVDDDVMKNGEAGSVADANSTDPVKKKFGNDFMTQLRMGKSFLHGTDKNGRPMCFVRVRLHKAGEQSEESLERYTVYVIETARFLLSPPVDTACVVFDMTGFSLANMDYAPVKFMIKCFEANYPESLGVVLVHKAPWIFQGIWKIIRGWLDPVVASKIQFTSDHAAMSEFVSPSQIPSEMGGTEAWEYKYIEPVPGENDIMKDTVSRDKILAGREELVKEYEKCTMAWTHATGDVAAARKRREELREELRVNYWRLDPYVRARTYYDRSGMINPGGKLKFYGDEEKKEGTAAVGAPVVGATPAAAAAAAPATVTAMAGHGAAPKPVETSVNDLD